jgi:hypothetical protein
VAKIIASGFVSLDRVMEAPGGEPGYRHAGWVAQFRGSGQFKVQADEVLAHEALLLGRRTTEGLRLPGTRVADKMNSMPNASLRPLK